MTTAPGGKWIKVQQNGEKLVREKWIWKSAGKPDRYGFNVEKNCWASDDKEKVPWGAPNVANSRRPQPHVVGAFDSPEAQAKQITDILLAILNDRVKSFKLDDDEKSQYNQLLTEVKNIQTNIVTESEQQINKIQDELTSYIDKVFPGYEVNLDAKPEDDLEKTISFFKANPQLLMGPKDGYKSPADRQGSGVRRTLLWTALGIIEENKKAKKDDKDRPHVLLIDEPEICLHPNAVREACDLLYNLPINSNWQVIAATHSPQFIDISRDNTTIVRVERDENGDIFGTTIFRPERAKLSKDDRENLKLLNIFDPYVAEFFFGGKTIVVEGDTEYTAFNYIIAQKPEKYKDIHIIRARGKATIVSLIKILNQFGTSYAILHDSDTPKATRKVKGIEQEIVNSAWTMNKAILAETLKAQNNVRLVASVPNFEGAYYNEELKCEKPYVALERLRDNHDIFQKIEKLLDGLLEFDKELPENAVEWNDIEILKSRFD
jgi:putative ATP-dependent endonuclease of OLD family